jgi:hypothetical protein
VLLGTVYLTIVSLYVVVRLLVVVSVNEITIVVDGTVIETYVCVNVSIKPVVWIGTDEIIVVAVDIMVETYVSVFVDVPSCIVDVYVSVSVET